MIDASYVDKCAIDVDKVENLLKEGATANVRSIKYTADSLLTVVLNSSHLADDNAYTCAELLVDYGAPGAIASDLDAQLDAFLRRYAASINRDKWHALGHKAFGSLWQPENGQLVVSANSQAHHGHSNHADHIRAAANHQFQG